MWSSQPTKSQFRLRELSFELRHEDMAKRNPVARHANQFNKSATFVNQKKAAKTGYVKHKGNYED